jgi:hypothetical protein
MSRTIVRSREGSNNFRRISAENRDEQVNTLTNCPDCSALISPRADACPTCGCPLARLRSEEVKRQYEVSGKQFEEAMVRQRADARKRGREFLRQHWLYRTFLILTALSVVVALWRASANPLFDKKIRSDASFIQALGAALHEGLIGSVISYETITDGTLTGGEVYDPHYTMDEQWQSLTQGIDVNLIDAFGGASSHSQAERIRHELLLTQERYRDIYSQSEGEVFFAWFLATLCEALLIIWVPAALFSMVPRRDVAVPNH